MPEPAPLIRIDENPIPDELSALFLEADDGARLRVANYPHPSSRGTVLVHPGWSEFLEKYIEVATDLHQRGYNVVLCDPRGQGYSQKVTDTDARGLIREYDRFVRDLDHFVDHMMTTFDGPYFLLAHSMGGLISLEWLNRGNDRRLAGAMLCAPMTQLLADPVKRAVARSIVRVGTALGAARRPLFGVREHSMHFETNNLTQDRTRHSRFKKLQEVAPDAQAGPPRFAWLNAGMAAINRINRSGGLDGITTPILLISADWDETVDPANHRVLAERYKNLQLVRIKDSRHEILMEADQYRHQAWEAIDAYMANRLAQLTEDRANSPPDVSSMTPSSTISSSTSVT